MRAALLIEPGRIVVDDVPMPEPQAEDVRVVVAGVGLCGSDQSVFRGTWAAPRTPWIMGHEAFGTIDAVGARVDAARIGETVVVEPNIPCGRCPHCRRGRTSACADRQSLGMNRPGALAERLVIPSANAWRVQRTAAADLVCVEPMTVVEAALRRLGGPFPEAALIVGTGAQGLLMSLALQRRGIRVYAADVSAARVAFAVELGARPLDEADVAHQFDLVVETTGIPDAVALAIARAEIGGTIVELGLDGRPFDLTAQVLVRRQLRLVGSLTYDHPIDFEASVKLIDEGTVAPGCVITDGYGLEDTQLALERAPTARGKTWIRVSL